MVRISEAGTVQCPMVRHAADDVRRIIERLESIPATIEHKYPIAESIEDETTLPIRHSLAPSEMTVPRVRADSRRGPLPSLGRSATTRRFAPPRSRQPVGFQDFVIALELLHLRVRNHGKLFKALLSVHVPGWRRHDIARRLGVPSPK